MHLACIWIVSDLSAKNYRNWWKFDEVLTKTNLLSFFWDTVYINSSVYFILLYIFLAILISDQYFQKNTKIALRLVSVNTNSLHAIVYFVSAATHRCEFST